MEKLPFTAYPLEDYPQVRGVKFPNTLNVAYAVCASECGNKGFIVDGQTQVCEYCGKLMFRTIVAQYQLASKDEFASHQIEDPR